ncbi:MAG: hypothetical protein Q8916_10655 [Bacteroidota bacterium]|nr:hypothetical protein [Bacteroidota bacterium]MDP4230849.1 hypothetical protein [Bacteroidota bacterium]MDP4235661.1 hypothetical protein [Bacteroidota bacterium]
MMQKLSRISFALFLVGWIASASIAQEAPVSNQPITKAGSLAMEFGFGGLSSMSIPGVLIANLLFPGEGTVDAVPVYAAGAKYYLSDGLALRAMLGFSTHTSGADSIGNGKVTGTTYGVVVGVEMHTHSVYAISPYFGAEVGYAGGSSTTTKLITDKSIVKTGPLAATSTTTETKLSASGFAVAVLAGFDWYVFHAVALGCEYGLEFSTASASSAVNGTTVDGPPSTLFGIGSAEIHLLIHL